MNQKNCLKYETEEFNKRKHTWCAQDSQRDLQSLYCELLYSQHFETHLKPNISSLVNIQLYEKATDKKQIKRDFKANTSKSKSEL